MSHLSHAAREWWEREQWEPHVGASLSNGRKTSSKHGGPRFLVSEPKSTAPRLGISSTHCLFCQRHMLDHQRNQFDHTTWDGTPENAYP